MREIEGTGEIERTLEHTSQVETGNRQVQNKQSWPATRYARRKKRAARERAAGLWNPRAEPQAPRVQAQPSRQGQGRHIQGCVQRTCS